MHSAVESYPANAPVELKQFVLRGYEWAEFADRRKFPYHEASTVVVERQEM